eukprot:CAMPEP_0119409022 /NCGR_PEP_ID=MMETSP1335-20130426/2404_1 /TAXON_ID=259385 /ORGANISM="Chrysoculter rhomboideus, Strain RCC1486" /LENGTH=94 /DNA_ID=CAMNT_0007433327 /DNA_START=73 /DNA_END=354 /DNA_ORIENTATION=+
MPAARSGFLRGTALIVPSLRSLHPTGPSAHGPASGKTPCASNTLRLTARISARLGSGCRASLPQRRLVVVQLVEQRVRHRRRLAWAEWQPPSHE